MAGLVVIAEALHRAVVLGDVEVDGPGTERIRHFFQCFVENGLVLPVILRRKQARLRRIVAHGVEQRVRHVGLEADGLRAAGFLERVDHVLPRVHAAPADLALAGQPLAIVGRNRAGLAESLGDLPGVGDRVLGPFGGAGRRIDADHAIGPHTQFAQAFAELAGLLDIGDELLAIGRRTHGGAAAHRRPDRRHDGADGKIVLPGLVGEFLHLVAGEVDVGVRSGVENVDAIELHPADLGLHREVDHGVEVDRRNLR